ncbi:MAG: hypothetical protein RLZZ417_2981 [Bacteroidota bacterium]
MVMKFMLTSFLSRCSKLNSIIKAWIVEKWQNSYVRLSTFIFLILLILGFTLPIIFRKPLALRVINSIDIDIIEQVNFSRVDFSLFRSFPFLNVRFSNFTTQGSKALGNSELLSVKYIDIAVDIWSVIDNSRPIYIRSIRLFEPKLTLLISQSGQKNYEVPLTNELISPTDSTSESKINFNLALQSIEISNGFLLLDDENANIYIKADGIWHEGSGDLSTSFYNLKTKTMASEFSISLGSSNIMDKARLSLDINFNIDNVKKEYIIKDNDLKINDLSLQVMGLVKKLPTNYYYDLNLYAPNNQFSKLMQLLPALKNSSYRQFKETKGNFNLGFQVKGPFQVVPRIYPSFNGFLKVNNGSIQDYFNEEGISDIQTYISICNDSKDLSNLEIHIPKMEACVEGKDFNLALYLKNPVYDPYVHGFVKGELNLNSLQKYLPLFSSNELKGMLNANIFMKGKMSDADKQNYEDVLMSGIIKLTDFSWKENNNLLKVLTLKAILAPDGLKLPFVKGSYNGNILSISGKFSNILAYFSPFNSLKGSFVISASETNLNKWTIPEQNMRTDFIKIDKETSKPPKFENHRQPLKIPYDFDLLYKAGKVIMKDQYLENVSFKGNYKENKLTIQSLSFRYNNINVKTAGLLLNADNYLLEKGVLKGNLTISASKFPFILPSTDLVTQSISKPLELEVKPRLIHKILPINSKKENPKPLSIIPERMDILGIIKIDSILSSDQTFNNIFFKISLKKDIVKMSKGIAYNKKMPILWQGTLNKQNNFCVNFDFNKFQTDLFSIPKQSPLNLFNLTEADKNNRPAGLKISGNIGNAPDYNFSNLNYLFFTNMNSLWENKLLQPFNGLKSQKIQTLNKRELKWWISYENKRFIFWPIYMQFKDIPFYFTGFQQGEKECYFRIKGLIPMPYFKMEEWLKLNEIKNYPDLVEVTIDIEDCMTDNFTLSIQIQSNLNESLKIRLEKYLKFELNRELRRIYGVDKLKNSSKQLNRERFNFLPSRYNNTQLTAWKDYYLLNDSLQTTFNSLKPKFKY